MPDGVTVAAALLVLGPVLGVFGFYDPGLWRVWTAPRAEHLALVAAHRRGWTMVNVGFSVATILTAGGLVMLSVSLDVTDSHRAGLVAVAVAYAIAGVLWCAVLAIRTRTTPLLGDLVAAGNETEPAEGLVGAAVGGLFSAFALTTSIALVVLGLILAVGADVAVAAGWSAVVIGVVGIAAIWRSGDLIPAVLYLPTLVLGISLLIGAA